MSISKTYNAMEAGFMAARPSPSIETANAYNVVFCLYRAMILLIIGQTMS
jgi:DNA-binding XRE family transcriptional regulator